MIDELRLLKEQALGQSDYLTALHYAELDVACKKELSNIDARRLSYLLRSVQMLSRQLSVPDAVMRKALTPDEFNAYTASFNVDISHTESDLDFDSVPEVLLRYSDLLSEADKLSKLAVMHRKRSRRRDGNGHTAAQRFERQAESAYETALMELLAALETDTNRNPFANSQVASEVVHWLDREVSTQPGHEPVLSAETMPRLRGSSSKYCLKSEPLIGNRKRRYWRDFTAVTEAALRYLDMN